MSRTYWWPSELRSWSIGLESIGEGASSPRTGRGRPFIGPEASQLQLHRLEGLGPDDSGVLPDGDDRPCALSKAQHLEGAVQGLDEPRVPDPGFGVDPKLAAAVDPLSRWGQHLAHPVGRASEKNALSAAPSARAAPPASQATLGWPPSSACGRSNDEG